jgi:enediyne polyketide synthase
MDTSNPLAEAPSVSSPIAVVGMGCWLPGAADPRHLWENVLTRRREFRRMPDNRTPLSDYYDPTGKDPDKFYQSKVAVLDGFVFDWASYRIPASSHVRTDVCQWLALEIAHRALQDAGLSRTSVPRDRTGVFIGNTCTGEGMRSNSLRLRWPVVRRALSKAAELQQIPASTLAAFMQSAEDCYKSIFPDINEDFVAGSISATIAGRICNYFDFHGGAFVIDGACASSLATVVTAANMLASNDLDLALAGGVDISLDPFELVGFSRNGALSKSEIRPYDRRGDGFIAGEGGGLVVLKRLEDARADGDSVYAVIRGWGMASDGKAGIMQPVASQQAAAVGRAAARAGFRLQQLDFIEGHGTGTRAGDRTELEGLALAMSLESPGNSASERSCGIGSLKSLIGHTKATAGVASLIKAVAAVNRRVVPPTAGCDEPNEAFSGTASRLFPIRFGEARSPDEVMRAGVSAFGFGGINTHIIIESADPPSPRLAPLQDERALLVSNQGSELFVFGGRTQEEVLSSVDAIASDALSLSQSDLVDLAASLSERLPPALLVRAAVIAESAEDLAAKLDQLRSALKNGSSVANHVYLTKGRGVGRIGFLFPGQGSQQLLMARALVERFDWARQLADEACDAVPDVPLLELLYPRVDRARDPSQIEEWTRALAATEVAQPAICFASVLCHRFLLSVGIRPSIVGGHSLGELTALYAAGAFDARTLLSIAALRGRLLKTGVGVKGAMASLGCSRRDAEDIIARAPGMLVIANINSPVQTVVSGEVGAIDTVISLAAERNVQCRRLPVTNAFHSPMVAQGAEQFETELPRMAPVRSKTIPIVSGVESVDIDVGTDLRRHLARQITSPVNFVALARRMKEQCDLLIEVGPGRVLSSLCRDIFASDDVCAPVASDALEWNPNAAVAAAFMSGASVNWRAFYAQRLARPYTSPSQRQYLSNPAEAAIPTQSAPPVVVHSPAPVAAGAVGKTARDTVSALLVELISKRTGYPPSSITAGSRLLDDLNLDSIKAGEVVAEALRRIGAAGAIDATRFANSSVQAIAEAIQEVAPREREVAVPLRPEPIAAIPAPAAPDDLSFVTRYPTWTRNFVIGTQEQARLQHRADLGGTGFLLIFSATDRELVDVLATDIASRGGVAEQTTFDATGRAALQSDPRFTHHVAVLPRFAGEGSPATRLAEMLTRVTSLAQAPARKAVAYIQFGGGNFSSAGECKHPESCNALAFARTLHLERKDLQVRVLDFAPTVDATFMSNRVLEEVAGDELFAAVGFDAQSTRRVPIAKLSHPESYGARSNAWSDSDVILVTGGAKGIMAECALGVARETGATVVLVGRGKPAAGAGADAAEIERTLERFRTEGLRHRYFSCDIVDAGRLAEVMQAIEAQVGPITGVIHGASILRPSRTEQLTVDGLLQEVSPKTLGAWNLCRVLRGKPLKQFVAISSLVVEHGMPWSAGYAFANEVMERIVTSELAETQTPLQMVSFGLWGQVGRPAVLNTNSHLLSVGLHDGEIPPEEGVRRLVEALTLDPGVQRLCIYGRSVGYPTWGQLRPKAVAPAHLRFIERVLHLEPEVEIIARCRLNLGRDRYLHDHVYNGMYIVPTVFALEMLAQAAYALIADQAQLCTLDAVEMPLPLVVDADRGLEIELRAVALEAAGDGLQRVNVTVSTEQTGFKTTALFGTVGFGTRRESVAEPIVAGTPVPIDPRADLYGRQFFVGPLFQRMKTIFSVDPDRSVCIAEIHSSKDAARGAFDNDSDRLVLGDPFFRDTLLHSSLLHHLQHMAFTSRIDRIELYQQPEAFQTEPRLCTARLQWSKDKDSEYELVAATLDGRVAERWTGFCAKALARTQNWPELQDLLDLERTRFVDERNLSEQIAGAAKQIGVTSAAIVLECISGFAELPIGERHITERALAARAVNLAAPGRGTSPELRWLPSGRPCFDGETHLDVSFSHEGWYCLCAVGSYAQGCDIAAIQNRSQALWTSLLGTAREQLLESVSKDESLDVAGTRIWAAVEAVRKASGDEKEALTLVKRVAGNVLFRAFDSFILTTPIHLSHGHRSIVALTVRMAEETTARNVPATRLFRDERLGCDVVEQDFAVTWKECTSLGRKAMAVCYIEWFHRVREAMLRPDDARRWVTGAVDRTAGLVARSIRVRVFGEVTAHDEIVARIWITQLTVNGARWRTDFFHRSPDEPRRLVAIVEAEGGVVGAAAAHERPDAIHDYGQFVETRPSVAQISGFEDFKQGRVLFELPVGPRRGPRMFVDTVRPSLIDSDLVGNVSSITFFRWLAHVRDAFLHSVAPTEMERRVGTSPDSLGEAISTEEEMTYLREAFPFDDLRVEVTLVAATQRSARLRYEFVRRKQGGASEKIAIGEQQFSWVHREADRLRSHDFPAVLLAMLEPPVAIEPEEIRQAVEFRE